MAMPTCPVQLAILVALSAGPMAMVQLGRVLPIRRDFGAALGELLRHGWVRGPFGFLRELEITEAGRRILRGRQAEREP